MKNSLLNSKVLDNLVEELNASGVDVAIDDTFEWVDNIVALSCTWAWGWNCGGSCGGGSWIKEL